MAKFQRFLNENLSFVNGLQNSAKECPAWPALLSFLWRFLQNLPVLVQFCFHFRRLRRVLQNIVSYSWFSWGQSVVAFSPNFIDLRSLLSVSPPLRSVGTSPLSLVVFFKSTQDKTMKAWTNALEHYWGVLHIRRSERRNPLYQEIRTKETLVFYSNSIYIRMPPTWSWTGNYRSVLCFLFVGTLHLSRGITE